MKTNQVNQAVETLSNLYSSIERAYDREEDVEVIVPELYGKKYTISLKDDRIKVVANDTNIELFDVPFTFPQLNHYINSLEQYALGCVPNYTKDLLKRKMLVNIKSNTGGSLTKENEYSTNLMLELLVNGCEVEELINDFYFNKLYITILEQALFNNYISNGLDFEKAKKYATIVVDINK